MEEKASIHIFNWNLQAIRILWN